MEVSYFLECLETATQRNEIKMELNETVCKTVTPFWELNVEPTLVNFIKMFNA